MMKRFFGIVLVLVMLMSLAACGGSESPTTAPQTTTAEQTTQDVLAEALNFLKEGEIYFDIHLAADTVQNLSISVDGKALGSDKKLNFKEGSSYDIKGEGKEGVKVLLLIVAATKDGNYFRNTHEFSSGDVEETLALMNRKLSRAKGDKVYVLLTEKKEDWDRNLGDALNQYLENALAVTP